MLENDVPPVVGDADAGAWVMDREALQRYEEQDLVDRGLVEQRAERQLTNIG